MILQIPQKYHAVDVHTHINLMPGCHYTQLQKTEALAMLSDGDRLGIEKFCISFLLCIRIIV